MSDTRISQLSITPTVGRQTPKRDFGDVLKASVGRVLNHGIVQGALGSIPVVSAAVSAVSSLTASSGNSSSARGGVAGVGPGAGSVSAAASSGLLGTGGPGGLAAAGNESVDPNGMLEEMKRVSGDYMQLQLAMQQENREYSAMTNVLKVRHDSAKSAINNIR